MHPCVRELDVTGLVGPFRHGLTNILKEDLFNIIILSFFRTPITHSYKSLFSSIYPKQLLHAILYITFTKHPNLDPALIDNIYIDTMLSELGGSKAGCMAIK